MNPAHATALPNADFWPGKRVLLTGHTGFKGAWLAQWLVSMGAKVTAVALKPNTEPNVFTLANVTAHLDSHIVDICDAPKIAAIVQQAQPEIVLHLAAQALVRESYSDPLRTFSVNVMGTANVLDALRYCDSVRSIVVVTTDKVYANQEWPWPYRETDRLGGHDPYSASKAGTEIVVASYRASYFAAKGVTLATARAGNVIGGGDWSADRIIPDAVRAWSANKGALQVRRPQAVRPWQHVIEPLCAYLVLAERAWSDQTAGQAWNFGPQIHEAATVREVVGMAQAAFGQGQVQWGDGKDGPHEAGLLMLDTSLAKSELGVQSVFALKDAIGMTMRWYRDLQAGQSAAELCSRDIAHFIKQATKND
jgi:CDP-glucose 4,6-dehydratase